MIFVASYCRVSTVKDDQANSFEAQQRHFRDYIDQELEALKARLRAAREYGGLTYDTATLRPDVRQHIRQLCQTTEPDEPFLKNVQECMTVYHDYRVTLRLNLIPPKWRFILDSLHDIRSRLNGGIRAPHAGCYIAPSVPTSVSRPFSSSKGME